MDNNSLAHTKWECKYHIVFAPEYRRQVIYKDIKADVGQILGTLCRRKGIEIIEAECCPDHIHMLVTSKPLLGLCRNKFEIILGSFYDYYFCPFRRLDYAGLFMIFISFARIRS